MRKPTRSGRCPVHVTQAKAIAQKIGEKLSLHPIDDLDADDADSSDLSDHETPSHSNKVHTAIGVLMFLNPATPVLNKLQSLSEKLQLCLNLRLNAFMTWNVGNKHSIRHISSLSLISCETSSNVIDPFKSRSTTFVIPSQGGTYP